MTALATHAPDTATRKPATPRKPKPTPDEVMKGLSHDGAFLFSGWMQGAAKTNPAIYAELVRFANYWRHSDQQPGVVVKAFNTPVNG